MRVRPVIGKWKSYVYYSYIHGFEDVRKLERGEALGPVSEELAKEFDKIGSYIWYKLQWSKVVHGKLRSVVEKKRRDFLIQKIRESKALARERESQRESILSEIAQLQQRQREIIELMCEENKKYLLSVK